MRGLLVCLEMHLFLVFTSKRSVCVFFLYTFKIPDCTVFGTRYIKRVGFFEVRNFRIFKALTRRRNLDYFCENSALLIFKRHGLRNRYDLINIEVRILDLFSF